MQVSNSNFLPVQNISLFEVPNLGEGFNKYFFNVEINPANYRGDFNPFLVNNHIYHAFGPCWTIDNAENKELAAEKYIEEIQKFQLVVNLIDIKNLGDPCYYLNYEAFDKFYIQDTTTNVNAEHYALYTGKNPEKQLLHIQTWSDGKAPDLNHLLSYLKAAAKVVEAIKNYKTVFVHCMAGLQRTSTFIVMCELLMYIDDMGEMTHEKIKGFILYTISQMAVTAYQRYPTALQFNFLFSDAFINEVKAKYLELFL